MAVQTAMPRFAPGEVLIKLKDGAGKESASVLSVADAKVIERIQTPHMKKSGTPAVLRLQVGMSVKKALLKLRADSRVAFAEPNWIVGVSYVANDPYYTNRSLWNMYGDASTPANRYGSQAAEAWANKNVGKKTVVVGVIDEGIDINHPDLAGNIWTNPHDPVDGVDNDGNGYVDDVNGWDFLQNNNTVFDGGGSDKHGTHVAGTIGAKGGNGVGVAGMCWNVTIVSCKFLGRAGGTIANAIKAVDYLSDLKERHGINIVASNNSWNGGEYSQALQEAIARGARQDILFVAAAGNGGSDAIGDDIDLTPNYPASYDTTEAVGFNAVIAVASITNSGARSSFSNYGRNSVHLGAPGTGIYSVQPYGNYGIMSGTSMATPHVTGAVALYRATHVASPAWDGDAIGSAANEVRNAILNSTIPTPSLEGITSTGGRLDVSSF